MSDQSSKWIPVEEYAVESETTAGELIRMIMEGESPGKRHENRWFVAAPLVALVSGGAPDGSDLLRISACCTGPYVTAGRGELGISVRFSDPGWSAALAAINTAVQTPPKLPVEIWLNGEHFLIDSSLWVDFGAALVEYQTLMDPSIEGPL